MKKQRKIEMGLTLFEILLSLFVISLVTLGIIKYVAVYKQNSAAQTYGENLYTYGQAAYQYVSNNAAYMVQNGALHNPAVTAAGQSTINPYYPIPLAYDKEIIIPPANIVSWLNQANAGLNPQTNLPYLPNSFSINQDVSPLLVAQPNASPTVGNPNQSVEGNQSLSVYIYYSSTSSSLPPLIAFVSGALYAQQASSTYLLRSDLTQNAVQAANTNYHSTQGGAAITYNYAYNPNALNVPVTGIVSNAALLGNNNNAYLQTAGANNQGNSMTGNISFLPTSSGEVGNLSNVIFDPTPPSGVINSINNLQTINMAAILGAGVPILPSITMDPTQGGTISNVSTLTMGRQYYDINNPVSSINNLQTLNFNASNGKAPFIINAPGPNYIQPVDSINFRTSGTSEFTGVQVHWAAAYAEPNNNYYMSTLIPAKDKNGNPISFCTFSRILSPYYGTWEPTCSGICSGVDKAAPRGRIYIDNFGNWVVDGSMASSAGQGNNAYYSVSCIQWGS